MKIERLNPPEPTEVSKQKVVDDLCEFLAKTGFTEDQIKKLYFTITNKMRSKLCYACGKLRPEIAGELRWPDGDMSKPKKFICGECKLR